MSMRTTQEQRLAPACPWLRMSCSVDPHAVRVCGQTLNQRLDAVCRSLCTLPVHGAAFALWVCCVGRDAELTPALVTNQPDPDGLSPDGDLAQELVVEVFHVRILLCNHFDYK